MGGETPMERLRDHDSQVVPTPPMSYQEQQAWQSKRAIIDQKFMVAGHEPEDPSCNHLHWRFRLHGRYCTCGSIMCDHGD